MTVPFFLFDFERSQLKSLSLCNYWDSVLVLIFFQSQNDLIRTLCGDGVANL